MEHYVGIDVSLELSSGCVLDGTGVVAREAKVARPPYTGIDVAAVLVLTI